MMKNSKPRRSQSALSLCVLALGLLSGCSGGDTPPLAEATGRITKGGLPMVNAQVEFYPEGAGAASYGTTDQDGKFELFYSTGAPGAAIGKHEVVVIGGGVEAAAASASPTMAGEDATEGTLAPIGMPAGRNRGGAPAETRGLSAEIVASGPNHIELELQRS